MAYDKIVSTVTKQLVDDDVRRETPHVLRYFANDNLHLRHCRVEQRIEG